MSTFSLDAHYVRKALGGAPDSTNLNERPKGINEYVP